MGKTEVARALASATGARLIRLQCHEGIDLHHALYDWDYQRQLLAIRAAEAGAAARELFGREFLLRRPLLEALEADEDVVLLIDEVDRADDEFEAFLLEFLADFAVTIPELGTVTARRRPLVVMTSNRTRELHDAIKRRCLYHWIDYPSREREADIVRARLPGVPEEVVARVCAAVARLRAEELYKVPGVGETITWARALLALGPEHDLDADAGRRAEGPRGHRAGAREPASSTAHERGRRRHRAAAGSRWPTLRARAGVRAGVGELLAAHRALAAVDAGYRASRRSTRCAPCSAPPRRPRRRSPPRSPRCSAWRRRRRTAVRRRCGDLSREAVLPRVAVPAAERMAVTAELEVVPAAWSEEAAAAREGLRRVHRRRARGRAAADRAARAARADAAEPAHAAGAPPRPPAGPARDHARVAAPGRRAARAALAGADAAPAPRSC